MSTILNQNQKTKSIRICFHAFISICILFLFASCKGKYPKEVSEFWKFFLSAQTALEEDLNYDQRQILFGQLSPKTENLTHPLEDGSRILSAWQRQPGAWETGKFAPAKYFYKISAKFTPGEFQEDATYKVTRETEYTSAYFSPESIFNYLDAISSGKISIQSLQSTALGKFLCESFDCVFSESEDKKGKIIQVTFSDATESLFPKFYEKNYKRLNQIDFSFQVLNLSSKTLPITISNNGATIRLFIPNSPQGTWAKTKKVIFRNSFTIRSLGLTVKISNLDNLQEFSPTNTGYTLTGKYLEIPEYSVTGRFLYILPTGIIDFFIPSNIDQYFQDYFTLLVKGSDGNGGQRLFIKTTKSGNTMKVYFRQTSEILQKRFSLFPESSRTERSASAGTYEFGPAIRNKLIEDLEDNL